MSAPSLHCHGECHGNARSALSGSPVRARPLSAAVALATVLAAPLTAQKGTLEIGADVIGYGRFTVAGNQSSIVELPAASVRFGYFLTDRISVEPNLTYSRFSPEDGAASSSYFTSLGVAYHVPADRSKPQLFVQPYLGLSGSEGGSDGSFALIGAAVGVKLPLAERVVLRTSANYDRGLSEGDNSFFGVRAGFSVYLR